MSKTELIQRLDRVFSLYIRHRDAEDGYCRCISCGRVGHVNDMQCGHFFSRSNMSTRWDEDNCHAQCPTCNCTLLGNLGAYRDALIDKIGVWRIESLRTRSREVRKWSEAELKEKIKYYTEKVKQLSQ